MAVHKLDVWCGINSAQTIRPTKIKHNYPFFTRDTTAFLVSITCCFKRKSPTNFRRRERLEKCIDPQVVKGFLRFYGTRMFTTTVFTQPCHLALT
jgi:hypothetical protein